MSDYNMDNKSICNGGGHIPYAFIIMWVIVDMGAINSEVAQYYIEEWEKVFQNYLAEKKQQLLPKQQQKVTENQAQGLAAISGLKNIHVLDWQYSDILTKIII